MLMIQAGEIIFLKKPTIFQCVGLSYLKMSSVLHASFCILLIKIYVKFACLNVYIN